LAFFEQVRETVRANCNWPLSRVFLHVPGSGRRCVAF